MGAKLAFVIPSFSVISPLRVEPVMDSVRCLGAAITDQKPRYGAMA